MHERGHLYVFKIGYSYWSFRASSVPEGWLSLQTDRLEAFRNAKLIIGIIGGCTYRYVNNLKRQTEAADSIGTSNAPRSQSWCDYSELRR